MALFRRFYGIVKTALFAVVMCFVCNDVIAAPPDRPRYLGPLSDEVPPYLLCEYDGDDFVCPDDENLLSVGTVRFFCSSSPISTLKTVDLTQTIYRLPTVNQICNQGNTNEELSDKRVAWVCSTTANAVYAIDGDSEVYSSFFTNGVICAAALKVYIGNFNKWAVDFGLNSMEWLTGINGSSLGYFGGNNNTTISISLLNAWAQETGMSFLILDLKSYSEDITSSLDLQRLYNKTSSVAVWVGIKVTLTDPETGEKTTTVYPGTQINSEQVETILEQNGYSSDEAEIWCHRRDGDWFNIGDDANISMCDIDDVVLLSTGNDNSPVPDCSPLTCEIRKKYNCDPGFYLSVESQRCEPCPKGSWCPGGTYYISDVDQGINSCSLDNSAYLRSSGTVVDDLYVDNSKYAKSITNCFARINFYAAASDVVYNGAFASQNNSFLTHTIYDKENWGDGYSLSNDNNVAAKKDSYYLVDTPSLTRNGFSLLGYKKCSFAEDGTVSIIDDNLIQTGTIENVGEATIFDAGDYGTVNLCAQWTPKCGDELNCVRGKYLPANSEVCEDCPIGSYCPGKQETDADWCVAKADKGKFDCNMIKSGATTESNGQFTADSCYVECGKIQLAEATDTTYYDKCGYYLLPVQDKVYYSSSNPSMQCTYNIKWTYESHDLYYGDKTSVDCNVNSCCTGASIEQATVHNKTEYDALVAGRNVCEPNNSEKSTICPSGRTWSRWSRAPVKYDDNSCYTNNNWTGGALSTINSANLNVIPLVAGDDRNSCSYKLYNITYNLNGGSCADNACEARTYTSEDADINLPTSDKMTKKGYDFSGWYEDENGTGSPVTKIEHGSSGDKTFYAKWTPIKKACSAGLYLSKTQADCVNCTNGYYCPGTDENNPYEYNPTKSQGKNSCPSSYKNSESKSDEKSDCYTPGTKACSCNIEHAICSYTGGSTTASCKTYYSETDEANNCQLDDTSACDVSDFTCVNGYKKNDGQDACEIETYNISYILNEGELPGETTNPDTYTIETPTFELNNPQKLGYDFAGWCENETLDVNCSVNKQIAKGSFGEKTFYAKWNEHWGTVRFICSNTKKYETTGLVGKDSVNLPTTDQCGGIEVAHWGCELDENGKVKVKSDLVECRAGYAITYKNGLSGDEIFIDAANNTLAPRDYTSEEEVVFPTPSLMNSLNINPGYSFNAWYDAQDFSGSYVTGIPKNYSGNRTVYAKYAPIDYTIKFNANSGTGTMNNMSFNVTETTKKLTANNFAKQRFGFKGWCTTPNCAGNESIVTNEALAVNLNMPADNDVMTLYAQWEPITYTINFDANGGTGNMQPMSFTINDTGTTLSANSFTRDGYSFKYWCPTSNCSDVHYVDNASVFDVNFSNTDTVTLYAEWDEDIYTITYDLDGGSLASGMTNPGQYTVESADITLNNPTKEGYIFTGWCDETNPNCTPSGTTMTISHGSTGNKTFYAKWTPIQYTVVFNGCGGSGTNPNGYDNINYGTQQKLPAVNTVDFVKSGYKFTNWCRADEESGVYKCRSGNNAFAAGSTLTDNLLTPAELLAGESGISLTICPIWTAQSYNITYNLNGGTCADNACEDRTYTVEDADINLPTSDKMTKKGFVFAGWYDNENGTGNSVTKIEHGSTGDKPFYAKWTAKTIICANAGEYLPEDSERCAACPANSYCSNPAGQQYTYTGSAQGAISCNTATSGEYPYSDGGVTATYKTACYHECSQIQHTALTGGVVYWSESGDDNRCEYAFKCESGTWFNLGHDDSDKICLYENKLSNPRVAFRIRGKKYYMMLDNDANTNINDQSSKKLRIRIGDTIYNAHDASINMP